MPSAPPPTASRWRPIAIALAACVALLTGCTGSVPPDPSGTAASAEANNAANDADLHFAETMPGHHDQAIEMSKMLLDKPGLSPELTDLARDIQASHQTRYETMSTWPSSWAAAAHHADDPNEDGAGHHGGQDGLMTEKQMEDLDVADTPTAQKLYLDGMIRHHQGALTIAADEIKNGKHRDAVTLAQTIASTYPDDIATMTALLAGR